MRQSSFQPIVFMFSGLHGMGMIKPEWVFPNVDPTKTEEEPGNMTVWSTSHE